MECEAVLLNAWERIMDALLEMNIYIGEKIWNAWNVERNECKNIESKIHIKPMENMRCIYSNPFYKSILITL